MQQRIDLQAIAKRLLAAGHTTGSIAKQIGVSQPSVSRLATGQTSTLNADAAMRLIVMAGGRVEAPSIDSADLKAA